MSAKYFALLCALCAWFVSFDQLAAKQPNILIIVGDDMGYADVGFHGCQDIPTKNLDALAAASVRFTNGYVSGPYCSPTRAGLLTGRYQTRFGHEFNPGDADGVAGLPLQQQTLADRLKAAGYRTGLVGKWHLGGKPDYLPQKRGFDQFFGFLGGAHSYVDAKGIWRGTEPVKELDYTTDAFAREAVAFIQQADKRPWFLYLAFNAVHTPMDATDARLAKFSNIEDPQRRKYNAMMLAMDEAIGQVMAQLETSGQKNDTLVCFISDNGGPTMKGTTVNGSRNHPLRGGKRTTLEGGIRVPFLVSWPAKFKAGVNDNPVIQLDLHATALAAAQVPAKPEWKLDGVDLLPFLNGGQQGKPHQHSSGRFGQQMAVRSDEWKLVRYDSNADTQTGKAQAVTATLLYNLAKDPHEDHDLAASMPDKVAQLQKLWDGWNADNVAPLWGGGNAAKKKKAAAE